MTTATHGRGGLASSTPDCSHKTGDGLFVFGEKKCAMVTNIIERKNEGGRR